MPIMIAAAARPELYERRPNWFEGRDFHRRVNLKPLSRRVCRGLVAEVLQKLPDVPSDLEELIVTQSEGNPFYVEELVKMLIEAGVVQAHEATWSVDQSKLEETEVPPTLSGVLQARLERLPDEERVLIQQAAVVGRVFWDQVVWYLNLEGDGRLSEEAVSYGLMSLRGRELIYRREQSTFEDALEYIFKHAVLREVTYEGVLKRLRKAYHSKIAEWLMEQRGDRKTEVVGLIADHLEAAEDLEEALRYLRWSGEEAAGRYANQEAVGYYGRALELIRETDLEMRYKLLFERQKLQDLIGDKKAWWQDLTELGKLTERLNDDLKRMEVGVRWARFATIHLEGYLMAVKKAREVIRLAEAVENDWYTAEGYLALGRAYLFSKDYDQPIDTYLDKALIGFRKTGDRLGEGTALRTLGIFAGWVQRDIIAHREFAMQALEVSQKVGDRSTVAEAINHLGIIAADLGQFEEAGQYYTQYLKIAQELGSKIQEMWAYGNSGALYEKMEDYQSARKMHETALEIAKELDLLKYAIGRLLHLGSALEGLNLPEQAVETFQQALKMMDEETDPIHWWRARARVIRAKRELGDTGGEKEFVEGFMEAISKGDNSNSHLPMSAHIVCIHLLLEERDDRAIALLQRAYEQLMIPARKITDENLRISYLKSSPAKREILRLWEIHGPAEKKIKAGE
jgi:tetratricopeptide (TPR) repeat protein